MEDDTGGCKTLLPGRNEYAGYVRKRTDQRTPAKDPPKKDANEIPRSELSRNYRRKIGGGDGRDGNDSDNERDKKGQSSRTHVGEVQKQKAPVKLETERLSMSDFGGGENYTFSSGNYYPSHYRPRMTVPRVLRFFLKYLYAAGDPNDGPASRVQDAPFDYVFPERSGNASYSPSTIQYDEWGNHISSVLEEDVTEAHHASDEDLSTVKSIEGINANTVPRTILEDVNAKKARRELEKNAERKWYKWKR